MSQEDDLRGLGKTIEFIRATAICLLVMNVFYFCQETFE